MGIDVQKSGERSDAEFRTQVTERLSREYRIALHDLFSFWNCTELYKYNFLESVARAAEVSDTFGLIMDDLGLREAKEEIRADVLQRFRDRYPEKAFDEQAIASWASEKIKSAALKLPLP